MLALIARSLARRWRRTVIIVLVIAGPLTIYGAVYPITLASYSQLQAYSTYTAGYVVVDTGSTYSGTAPAIYISNQNISKMESIEGVGHVYGLLHIGFNLPLEGVIYTRYSQSNCSGPPLPQIPGIKHFYLGGSIIAFDTSAVSQTALPYEVVGGRLPSSNESGAVAVNMATHQCLGLQIGDSLSTSQLVSFPNSSATQWENATLRVVGIYATPPSTTDIGSGQMPEGIMGLSAALASFPVYSGRYSTAWVIVRNVGFTQGIGNEIQATFPNLHVYYPSSLVQQTLNLLNAANGAYSVILYLAIISAAIVTFLMTFYDLQWRAPEIGLYLSQGWNGTSVSKYEFGLSVLRGAIGGLTAVALSLLLHDFIVGLLGFHEVTSTLDYRSSYYITAFIVIIGIALFLPLASSFVGLRHLVKKTPTELIRR